MCPYLDNGENKMLDSRINSLQSANAKKLKLIQTPNEVLNWMETSNTNRNKVELLSLFQAYRLAKGIYLAEEAYSFLPPPITNTLIFP